MVTAMGEVFTSSQSFSDLIKIAHSELKQSDCKEIKIDCTSIMVVRSEMLDQLIRLHLKARHQGASVALENVNELFHNALTITRIDRMLQVRVDAAHKNAELINRRKIR